MPLLEYLEAAPVEAPEASGMPPLDDAIPAENIEEPGPPD
jgi:hypothetical protein